MLNFFRENSRILSKLLFYQFGAAFFSGMMILAVPDNSTTLGLVIGMFCAFFLVFLNHFIRSKTSIISLIRSLWLKEM